MEEIFMKMDELMLSEAGQKELTKISKSCNDNAFMGEKSFAGCTATVLLVTPTELYCSNAGDSRTVLSKRKTA